MSKSIEYIEENCGLTEAQLKAAKKVYAAMKAAGKLGVTFWDNYGTLECYNNKKITLPTPESSAYKRDAGEYSLNECCVTYSQNLNNFYSGNADDELFFDLV